jgi:O-antigen/teichoic acid export membrane protein
VIQLAFVYAWTSVQTGFRFRMRTEGIWDIMKKGWPLAASAVLTLVYFRGDTIILSLLHSARDVGIYGVAYKVLEHSIFIPIAFAGLVMPLLSRFAFADTARFRLVFQKGFDFLAILALPFAAGGIWVAHDIVYFLAGSEFQEAVLPLQVLFVAIVFIFFGALLGNALIAARKQHALMWVYGIAAVLNILANIYFITRYSYVGAAWVTAGTELLVSSLMIVLLARATGVIPSLRVTVKASAASAIMLAVLFVSPVQHITALVPLGAVVYILLLYLLGGVSRNDLQLFFRSRDTQSPLAL